MDMRSLIHVHLFNSQVAERGYRGGDEKLGFEAKRCPHVSEGESAAGNSTDRLRIAKQFYN